MVVDSVSRPSRHGLVKPVALCLAFASPLAFANGGAPLVLATAFHLFIGNTIIGVLEGVLIARVFRVDVVKAFLLMIPANYFSSFIGFFAINGTGFSAASFDITNFIPGVLLVIFLTYVMTLFLEAPFIALVEWRAPKWGLKVLYGSLIAQTCSYVLLFGLYSLASSISLCTANRVVPVSAMTIPKNITMYYIDATDGNVYKSNVAVPGKQTVFALDSKGLDDRLIVQKSVSSPGRWDLAARIALEDWGESKIVKIAESFTSNAAPSWMAIQYDEELPTSNNADGAAQLGDAADSDLSFSGGLGALEGLSVWRKSTKKEEMRFAFQMPGLIWNIRNLTHLPSDKVLFQLGDYQICVFDPNTRQIALVARGRGPIAILEDAPGDTRE